MASETIMHCFDSTKAEAEGKLIGSLLAGYGELELEMTDCVIAATTNSDSSIKALFRRQGEKRRINTADSMMKATYEDADLLIPYEQAISDMHWCRKIRNHYAHCQWYYKDKDGLCLVNLEQVASLSTSLADLAAYRISVDVKILENQMAFFVYLRKCFWYLAENCRRHVTRKRKPGTVLRSPVYPIGNYPVDVPRDIL